MHKRTFKALRGFPRVATVWGSSPLRGRCGEITSKDLEREAVCIVFTVDGDREPHLVSFRDVALGDNSQ